ncbi:hypothetical protein ASPWEDRAFT_28307 [Aspergillus wentii DTO 134E9]|uniref:Aminoglycoside phosphotransferase domain-containing protein n=1 Tax=Aspergillus wentii DTO 134E9 TaxID=1073089 RepID=A0A1L9RLF8_ASPWE|nr:uncharacterized protein ASPWEDRAFT_28307 [Aspergillus wentii DTO 134E9]KAI9924545.1 hypothetical protein MW887_006817 [Aspergillus wentii]OJJ35687.1 hypothetical protein ASPWEDRAFT_28307 [Aspergillus wentii DTO 134E9]
MSSNNISTEISQEISQTPYACSSLTHLSGGTANFVYRGILTHPLQDGTTTVIIKHGKDYIASNQDFKLPTERCVIEETILNAMGDYPAPQNNEYAEHVSVKTPHLFHFNRETNTQILEDLPDAMDLKSFFSASPTGISESHAGSIGQALGGWLSSFHSWTAEEKQSNLAVEMEKNKLMQDLKFSINYESLVQMVDKYPALLKESKDVFEKVRDSAAKEVGRKDGDGFGIIHGDFWSGNVLIPKNVANAPNTTLFIIDWELCHCGARALDLGQMIAELYMLKHFKDIDPGLWVIQGFAQGYHEQLNEDLAFRIVIHVGVHLVFWGSTIPGWGTEEQVEEVVKIGRDFVVKGWEKEKAWFEGGPLGCLFS